MKQLQLPNLVSSACSDVWTSFALLEHTPHCDFLVQSRNYPSSDKEMTREYYILQEIKANASLYFFTFSEGKHSYLHCTFQ